VTQAHRISITDADRAVLGPLAEHRILIVPQLALLLGLSEDTVSRRLKRLRDAGHVHYGPVFDRAPWPARITGPGLRAIGRPVNPPRERLQEHRHDVGVGWLWLAARAGAFGAAERILTDRGMRSADAARSTGDAGEPYGIGLGTFGPHGQRQRHYPDLMIDTAGGHRVAVELELTQKSAERMRRIMTAYATDSRIDAVLYVVPSRRLAELVTESARRAGVADIVHVKRLAPDGIAGAEPGSKQRTRARAPVARGAER